MGRSRSRSRSSSSRSSSSSEDSVEREEREQKERERREQKAYEKEQRRVAKEQCRAADKKARLEAAAIEKANSLVWNFSIPPEPDADLEDLLKLTLVAKKKAYMGAAVVDVQDWAALEVYLRSQFEVDESIKRIKLAVQVELDGEVRLRSSAFDATTLGTVHFNIIDLGAVLLEATAIKITASVTSAVIGKKLKAKAKARTRKQEEASAKWNDLKKSIYGSTNLNNSYTTGTWKNESSDIMRREHDYMATYFETRALCEKARACGSPPSHPTRPHPHTTHTAWDPTLREKVMGCAEYHPNPCVLICPFEGCKKGRRQLNGPGLVSQLYSHWQSKVCRHRAHAAAAAATRPPRAPPSPPHARRHRHTCATVADATRVRAAAANDATHACHRRNVCAVAAAQGARGQPCGAGAGGALAPRARQQGQGQGVARRARRAAAARALQRGDGPPRRRGLPAHPRLDVGRGRLLADLHAAQRRAPRVAAGRGHHLMWDYLGRARRSDASLGRARCSDAHTPLGLGVRLARIRVRAWLGLRIPNLGVHLARMHARGHAACF